MHWLKVDTHNYLFILLTALLLVPGLAIVSDVINNQLERVYPASAELIKLPLRFSIQTGNANGALYWYKKLAARYEDRRLIETSRVEVVWPANVIDKKSWLDNMKMISYEKYVQFDSHYAMARDLYELGIQMTATDPQLARACLNEARLVAPVWSYYAVELANLVWQDGSPEEAKQILNECIRFPEAQVHCRSYKQRIETGFQPEPVGFLRELIEAH